MPNQATKANGFIRARQSRQQSPTNIKLLKKSVSIQKNLYKFILVSEK
jgi:hypothetical protein